MGAERTKQPGLSGDPGPGKITVHEFTNDRASIRVIRVPFVDGFASSSAKGLKSFYASNLHLDFLGYRLYIISNRLSGGKYQIRWIAVLQTSEEGTVAAQL